LQIGLPGSAEGAGFGPRPRHDNPKSKI